MDPTDKASFIWVEDQGIPDFQATEEQQEIPNTDSRHGTSRTKATQRWVMQVPVSKEAFKADQVGKRAAIGTGIGQAARRTQTRRAMVETYGDGIAGSFNTMPHDLQPAASNSHTTISGNSADNLETGSLTPDNLWTLVTSLANQRGQHGDSGSQVFEGILVPFTLFRAAKEIMNSVLVANSGENNINVFDTDYGMVRIGASVFLGSTWNSAANANTSYHIVSRNHQFTRKVFYDLETKLIPPENTANHSYIMRALYSEAVMPATWTGYAASNGTT